MVDTVIHPKRRVRIGVVGKYSDLQDAYKSIYEALTHGGIAHKAGVDIVTVAAEAIEGGQAGDLLRGVDGILVPGGFGTRGVEGKIDAIRYARENGVPFLGICLGLQCAVIEFARNVCGLAGAHSTEFVKDAPHPVVCLMEEQEQVINLGGTMRLGAWPCSLTDGSKAARLYDSTSISERHRHRYEVNNKYRAALEDGGLVLSGLSPDGGLVEMIELPSHPFFVATQAHPEFKSQPMAPHPLFAGLVGAAVARAAKGG
jgi:CTP synthase